MQTLIDVYYQTDEQTKQDGRLWYQDAYSTCRHLSIGYGRPLLSVIGAAAALSVGVKWEKNIEDLITMLRAWRKGQPLSKKRVHTYGKQAIKAASFIVYPPTSLYEVQTRLGSQAWKTQSFALAIYTKGGYCYGASIVVDRHIKDMLGNPNLRSLKNYQEAQNRIIEAAKQVNEYGPQFQAITWLQWRKMKGIK